MSLTLESHLLADRGDEAGPCQYILSGCSVRKYKSPSGIWNPAVNPCFHAALLTRAATECTLRALIRLSVTPPAPITYASDLPLLYINYLKAGEICWAERVICLGGPGCRAHGAREVFNMAEYRESSASSPPWNFAD